MKIAPRRSIIAIIFGLTLAFSLLLVFSSSDGAQATGNFNPTLTQKLCNAISATFPDTSLAGSSGCTNALGAKSGVTGAPRTQTTRLNIPNNDLNFSSLITFEPSGVTHTPGCNVDKFNSSDTNDGILDGRDFDGNGVGDGVTCLRPGDKLGALRSLASLGTLNGPCTQLGLTVDFVLFDVALPNNTNNPRASTNIYTPLNEGVSNRISNGITTLPNPLQNVAGPTSLGIQNYPDWLLDIFDPDWLPVDPPVNGPNDGVNYGGGSPTRQNPVDGPEQPIIPLAVYGSISNVAGNATPLYFVQFDDDQLSAVDAGSAGFAAPHPFSRAVSTLGKPSVTILTDTTPIIIGTSPISDFCTQLISDTMLLGTTLTDSRTRATNPASAGTHLSLTWTSSQRDLDNDTFEAQIDTCPKLTNTDTDPRSGSGDPDGDMIDKACDPDFANSGCGTGFANLEGGDDCDGDGFQNALDNCPLISNVKQTQGELFAAYSATAADGGPVSDGIGDACDSGTWTGTQNGVPSTSVTLATNVSNGHYHVKGIVMPTCYDPTSTTDADTDGWCLSDEGSGKDGSDLLHPKLDDWVIGGDHDGDGENAWLETFVGTEDAQACSATTTKEDEPLDSFFSDFDDSKRTDIFDIVILKPAFFKIATQGAYIQRVDLDGSTRVDIFDIVKLKPQFFKTCTFTPQQ